MYNKYHYQQSLQAREQEKSVRKILLLAKFQNKAISLISNKIYKWRNVKKIQRQFPKKDHTTNKLDWSFFEWIKSSLTLIVPPTTIVFLMFLHTNVHCFWSYFSNFAHCSRSQKLVTVTLILIRKIPTLPCKFMSTGSQNACLNFYSNVACLSKISILKCLQSHSVFVSLLCLIWSHNEIQWTWRTNEICSLTQYQHKHSSPKDWSWKVTLQELHVGNNVNISFILFLYFHLRNQWDIQRWYSICRFWLKYLK